MSPELDADLCAKYPKIFVNRQGDPTQTAMCWGLECGDGWYTLIDELCRNLQWNTDKNNRTGKYPQVVAVQVKEKFGTLRFYVESSTELQSAMIEFAESMSGHICDVCGNKGRLRKGGWLTVRCDEHVGQ